MFLNSKTLNYLFIGAYHDKQQEPDPEPFLKKILGAGTGSISLKSLEWQLEPERVFLIIPRAGAVPNLAHSETLRITNIFLED